METTLLSDPTLGTLRDMTASELIKGGWFEEKDSFGRFIQCLNLGTRLTASLVEPGHTLLTIDKSDYKGLLKTAFAHWIRKSRETATISNLSNILWANGFRDAAMNHLTKPDQISLQTPVNGNELQNCLQNCKPGDTILLKPETEYVGCFVLTRSKIKIQGGRGSELVGLHGEKDGGVILTVQGSDCTITGVYISGAQVCIRLEGSNNTVKSCSFASTTTKLSAMWIKGHQTVVDGVECYGSKGIGVKGDMCSLTAVKLSNLASSGIVIWGSDNSLSNVFIDGNNKLNAAVRVEGGHNHFENVKTTNNCQTGLYLGSAANNCVFRNCIFGLMMGNGSDVGGTNHDFVNVDFDSGVYFKPDARQICLTQCRGNDLVLAKKAQVDRKECTFVKTTVHSF